MKRGASGELDVLRRTVALSVGSVGSAAVRADPAVADVPLAERVTALRDKGGEPRFAQLT